MLGRQWLVAILVAGSFASPAYAGEYYYFYKAGVSRETFHAEKVECEELAQGGRSPDIYVPPQQNIYAEGAAAFLTGFMQAGQRRRLREAIQRTCMADKGYERIGVPKSVIEDVNRLDGEARVDRMAEMAGASTPLGERLPE